MPLFLSCFVFLCIPELRAFPCTVKMSLSKYLPAQCSTWTSVFVKLPKCLSPSYSLYLGYSSDLPSSHIVRPLHWSNSLIKPGTTSLSTAALGWVSRRYTGQIGAQAMARVALGQARE